MKLGIAGMRSASAFSQAEALTGAERVWLAERAAQERRQQKEKRHRHEQWKEELERDRAAKAREARRAKRMRRTLTSLELRHDAGCLLLIAPRDRGRKREYGLGKATLSLRLNGEEHLNLSFSCREGRAVYTGWSLVSQDAEQRRRFAALGGEEYVVAGEGSACIAFARRGVETDAGLPGTAAAGTMLESLLDAGVISAHSTATARWIIGQLDTGLIEAGITKQNHRLRQMRTVLEGGIGAACATDGRGR